MSQSTDIAPPPPAPVQIAIGCPVRNRAWVLPTYLDALHEIDYDDRQFLFVENDSTDSTKEMLWEWANKKYPGYFYEVSVQKTLVKTLVSQCPWRETVTTNIVTSDAPAGHERGQYGRDQYAHLAAMRNELVAMFLETDAEYLLSVDSDVMVPADVLQRLLPLADENTIVGAAISNIPDRKLDGKTCGNFMVAQAGLILHPANYPLSGTMEVDVTGACCLIPRAVLEKGVRYGPHHQGEDVAFCLAAQAAGARIIVTFDVRPEHRMVE